MSICYAIKDWNMHFENSESRKIKSLTWLPVKNKHDGKGYRRVCQHPKSISVFCAWHLLIQVASKMPVRGLLRDEDGPLTASDLSAKTGFPESIFEEAFKVLVEKRIGWLIVNNQPPVPGESPGSPGSAGVEQNGTEQTGREGKDNPSNAALIAALGDSKGGQRPMAEPPPDHRPAGSTAGSGSLTMEALPRLARACLDSRWHWDNCKVTPEMFTQSSLVAVLRPYAGRVDEARVIPCFIEAVKLAHARCVDRRSEESPIHKPGALAVVCLRELLGKNR